MARRAPPKGELAQASGSRDITAGYLDQLILQPNDPILRGRGYDIRVYQDLLRDDQVAATIQQRWLAVVSREWSVEAGGTGKNDEMAADFLREQLDALRFDELTRKMLFGIFYGWAVAECIWARDGARIVAEDIRVRRRERFRWDRDGNLRLLLPGRADGEIMPPEKFWTFSAGAETDDEPYGLGLAHYLYWPVYFKRNDVKFWLIFLEKFAAPTVIGYHSGGASPDQKATLMAAARAVATDTAVTMPDSMRVELLEAARGGAATYRDMAEVMDRAISKIVLSQTMTTDDGASLSQAQVHGAVRDEVVKSDADLVCQSFSAGPATWLTNWNFPGAAVPRVWRRMEDEPDLKSLAERDEILTRVGWRPSAERVRETYGEGYEPAAGGGKPGADPDPDAALGERVCPVHGVRHLAEGGRDAVDDLADQLDQAAAPAMDAMIDRVRAIVDGSASLEEMAEGIAGLYAELPADEVAAAIRDAMALAELTGRSDQTDGT